MTDKRQLYNQFLEVFPLSKLNDLTLDEYTNLNRDNSFCYWIESRTHDLGSFWGGSSYKFGIYAYRKKPASGDYRVYSDDKYAWYGKYNQDTAEGAFGIVKRTIVRIANCANEGKFEEIESINELGEGYKWKIAFLYSHEHLIPIYKKEMLQTLAKHFNMDANISRVEIQKRLIEIKGEKDLYAFYDELLKIIEAESQSKAQRTWLFAPGENACIWEDCMKSSTIRIGWDMVGDLSAFDKKEEITSLLQSIEGKTDASFKNDSLALWQFAHEMKTGDVVYVKTGKGILLGKGFIKGDYRFEDTLQNYPHVRQVEWLHTGSWSYVKKFPMKTLTDISSYTDLIQDLESLIGTKEKYNTTKRQYWWLIADPKVWKFTDISVGEVVNYTLYSDNGNKRRIFQNFLDAKEGDGVIGYASTPTLQVVALGEIAKDTDKEYLYFRKMEQLLTPIDYSVFKQHEDLQDMECLKGNGRGSLFKLKEEEYETILEIVRHENPEKRAAVQSYTDKDFLSEVYMNAADFQHLKSLLSQKKNVILQGAPGVGKTFTAERLAYTMMGVKEPERIEKVQFHQSFPYEDFIMGYKPTEQGGFELRTGIFYQFCQKAKNSPDKEFFFIIDEINRGNLSKIFGELLMLIENGYRNTEINLAYTGKPFSVPDNLYIIGMMNTADRSLAMIDYALRRRFSFFEMKPGFDSKGFIHYQKAANNEQFNQIIEAIRSLNKEIEKDHSLGSGFCIGHSYFCNYDKEQSYWLDNVVKYDIIPMLKEYWFDNEEKYQLEVQKLKDLLNEQ